MYGIYLPTEYFLTGSRDCWNRVEVTLIGVTQARTELPLATETASRAVAVAYDIRASGRHP